MAEGGGGVVAFAEWKENMNQVKEPIESYEVDEDGEVYHVVEYGPEDQFLIADGWEDPNYTQVPNQLLGSWKDGIFCMGQMTDMNESELKVALALCRITFGFHRDHAAGTLGWLMKATGMCRQAVLNGIAALVKRGLFIQDKSPDGTNLWHKVHGGLSNRPEAVYPIDQTGLCRRPNKERLKKEEIKSPTPAASVSVSSLLRSTLSEDENTLSDLGEYIKQEMGIPPSQGQCTKLATTYTEQTTNGKVKHPSPNDLWRDSPLFRQYVEQQVAYYRTQSGTPASKRSRLVNSLCAYKTPSGHGWLDYASKQQEGETTHTPLAPGWQTEAEKKEYTEEELDEMAERLSQQKPVRTGVILR